MTCALFCGKSHPFHWTIQQADSSWTFIMTKRSGSCRLVSVIAKQFDEDALLEDPLLRGMMKDILKEALSQERASGEFFDKDDPDDVDHLFEGDIMRVPRQPFFTHEPTYYIPEFNPEALVGSHVAQAWPIHGKGGGCMRVMACAAWQARAVSLCPLTKCVIVLHVAWPAAA